MSQLWTVMRLAADEHIHQDLDHHHDLIMLQVCMHDILLSIRTQWIITNKPKWQ